jgi:hypothetical protein
MALTCSDHAQSPDLSFSVPLAGFALPITAIPRDSGDDGDPS